jgi:hypothetical protein
MPAGMSLHEDWKPSKVSVSIQGVGLKRYQQESIEDWMPSKVSICIWKVQLEGGQDEFT